MQPPAEGLASRLFLVPALRTQPDRRLVALVREGYETAFEEIVRRYGRPLSRYAASIVGGRCDDVLQDAFSKALPALRRDDTEIDLRPWLFRIVRNTALNDLRDRPPTPEALAESLVGGGGDPAEEFERREELADLMRRLQALPEAQRAAIVMRELEGLSHEEIARALGMSGGAARQAIYRARRALRDGIGMLVPLPLLQSMLAVAATPGAGETAAGMAGAGGAGVGAGMALKATAATVLVAGVVGAGVAVKPDTRGDPETATAKASRDAAGEAMPAPRPESGSDSSGEDRQGNSQAGDRGRGPGERGNDRHRHGRHEPGARHGAEAELGHDRGRRGGAEHGDGHGGRSAPSEHRGGSSSPTGEDRSGSGDGDRSGSSRGDSGSGSDDSFNSEHSGSGSGESSGSGVGAFDDSSGSESGGDDSGSLDDSSGGGSRSGDDSLSGGLSGSGSSGVSSSDTSGG